MMLIWFSIHYYDKIHENRIVFRGNYMNSMLNPWNCKLDIVVVMFIYYLWIYALSHAPQVIDRMFMWIKWWNHDMLVYVQAYALQVFDKMPM